MCYSKIVHITINKLMKSKGNIMKNRVLILFVIAVFMLLIAFILPPCFKIEFTDTVSDSIVKNFPVNNLGAWFVQNVLFYFLVFFSLLQFRNSIKAKSIISAILILFLFVGSSGLHIYNYISYYQI